MTPASSPLHRAQALHRAGQPEAALRLLAEAAPTDPAARRAFADLALAHGHAGALVQMAQALAARGAPAEAAELLGRFVSADPGNAEGRAQRANWLAESGAIPAAIAEYRAAIALKPALAGAWGNLANQLVRWRRDPAAAGPAYRAALLTPHAAMTWADLGRALRLAGRPDDAAEALALARRLDPALDYANHHAIEVAVELGRFSPAMALLASTRRPDERAALARLAEPDDQPRIITLDPGLIGRSGHHYNFARVVAAAARRHGRRHLLLAGRQLADPALRDGLAALPILASWPHGGGAPLRHRNAFFQAQLAALPAGWVGPHDALLFHTPSAAVIGGFAAWLATLPADRRPALAVGFMLPDFLDGQTGALAPAAEEYRRFLDFVDPARAILSVETADNQRMLSALSGGRVPIEVRPPFRLDRPPRRLDPARTPLTIAHLGQSRPERGTHFLPEIVAGLKPTPRLAWLLQINRANVRLWAGRFAAEFSVDQQRLLPALAALEGRADVTLLGDDLDSDAYYAALDQADILVLPYAARYTRSGSGVFREALAQGKVIVGPAASSLADEAAAHGAGFVAFDRFSPAAVAAAVDDAIARFPALADRAWAAARSFRATNDQDGYFDRLIACADQSTT